MIRRLTLFATPRKASDYETHFGCPRCGGTMWIGRGTEMEIKCQHYPMMRGQLMAVADMPETPRILAGGIKPKIRVAGGSI